MGIEAVSVDRERMTEVIETIMKAENSKHLLRSESELPESRFVRLLNQQAPPPFAVNALFLTTTMVFAENTYRFFKRISYPELLNRYQWLFMPERVVEAASRGIDVKAAGVEFFRPGGYSRAAIDQWVHNCQVLSSKYNGDVRNFFKENDYDGVKIVDALVVRPRAKTIEKPDFRRYGPKVARLAIQWVGQYDLCKLNNLDLIGLPVDFQVARLLIQTRAIDMNGPVNSDLITRRTVLPEITRLCQENGWKPAKVSERMWLVGSQYCNTRSHDLCPISEMCTRMISRRPYDKDGLFDPADVGRYPRL